MLFLYLKLIIGAFFLFWGTRAQEIQINQLAGPAEAGAMIRPQVQAGPQLVLKMAADGSMTFEGQAVTVAALEKLLTERLRQAPATALKIEIAPGLAQDRLFDIVDLAENAGISSIVTDPPIDIPPAATFELGE